MLIRLRSADVQAGLSLCCLQATVRFPHVDAHMMLKLRLPCFRLAAHLITVQAFTTLCVLSNYPHAFLKKRRGYCNRLRPSVRPSVRPSRYLLLNHWTKSNQIWCVCCSHEWGVQRHIFFGPAPFGPWGGAKRSNIIKYH